MKCYDVICKDNDGIEYHVGVMTSDADKAKASAEKSLFEGRHLKATAVTVTETNAI